MSKCKHFPLRYRNLNKDTKLKSSTMKNFKKQRNACNLNEIPELILTLVQPVK